MVDIKIKKKIKTSEEAKSLLEGEIEKKITNPVTKNIARFFAIDVPEILGVKNPVPAGMTALNVFFSEYENEIYSEGAVDGDTRLRVEAAMPYQVPIWNLNKRDHYLDLMELLTRTHRKACHPEDGDKHDARIKELWKKDFSEREKRILNDGPGLYY
jgi:hypothetical protein